MEKLWQCTKCGLNNYHSTNQCIACFTINDTIIPIQNNQTVTKTSKKKRKSRGDGVTYDPDNDGLEDDDYWLHYSIKQKKDWQKKVFNESIIKKWKQEATTQREISSEEFDKTIKGLQGMAIKAELLPKLETNQYYSSDTDISIFHDDNPYNHGVIERKEQELNGLKEIGDKLRQYIDEQIEGELTEDDKDWHPGSNKMVLDLVHPSLFCYVANKSDLIDTALDEDTKQLIDRQKTVLTQKRMRWATKNAYGRYHHDHDKLPHYERYKYQWLPAEFSIKRCDDGKHVDSVKIDSYINNLDRLKHTELYGIIEEVFRKMVPLFDEAYTSVVNLKDINKSRYSKEEEIDIPQQLPDNVQVIVKLANIVLDKDDEKRIEYSGGSWHIEGMEYEHIIASGIYYYDIDNIKGSYLQFRKGYHSVWRYEQNDEIDAFTRYGIADRDEMNKYLGKLAIDERKCIVFPNTLQHRVSKFKLRDNDKNGRRKILVFFLIDPRHKIVSTKHVGFQQSNVMKNYLKYVLKGEVIEEVIDIIVGYMAVFTIKEAMEFREKLMFVRGYVAGEKNEVYTAKFNLCEH